MEAALMALPMIGSVASMPGTSVNGGWSTTVTPSGLSALGSGGGATALQGGGSALSALMAIGAGRVQHDMHSWAAGNVRTEAALSARGEELNAEAEYLAGANAAVNLRENLNRTIGGQRVAFAASGVDAFSGSPASLEKIATDRTAGDLDLLRSQTEINALQRQIKASQIRQRGVYGAFKEESAGIAAEASGWMQALSSATNFAGAVAKRG